MEISTIAQVIANENDFIIKSFHFPVQAGVNSENVSKIIRIGSVQTSTVAPTTSGADEQMELMFCKVEKIVKAAAVENVNILCLPEMWCGLGDFKS